jgi:hypothetical protein
MIAFVSATGLSLVSLVVSARPQEATAAPERGLRIHEEGAFPGYTLFTPLQSGSTYLIDMQGEVVHEWKTSYGPGASVYLLENGHLLRCTRVDDNPRFWGGGIGGRILELDWDGQVVWTYVLSDGEHSQHHDIDPMPDGNILVISWEYLSREEALARGRDADLAAEEGLWPDAIFEIEPVRPEGGKVVWEWHAKDHLIQDRDPELRDFGVVEDPERLDINGDRASPRPLSAEEQRRLAEQEEELRALGYIGGDPNAAQEAEEKGDAPRERRGDWLHTNSVDYDPVNELVILSSPHFDELWIIDHSTTTAEAATSRGGRRGKGGDLLWRWGDPRRYGAGSEADQRLFGQHDAQWIEPGLPGAGHVLVFNNGRGRPGTEYSSIEELTLPFDPARGFTREPGKPFGPSAPVWSYVAPEPADFYSFFISGCQRLPNGNTLICSGKQGRFFEVTREGRVVWEYLSPFGGEIPSSFGGAAPKPKEGAPPSPVEPVSAFRATRIPLDHPGLAGRNLGKN